MWKTGYRIDTKQAQEESPTNQQPMKRLDSISFASVVMISSSYLIPSAAEETPWRGVNEQKWAELIQSDINSQASAETICTNSTNFATTSREAAFKVWANSLAQKLLYWGKWGRWGRWKSKGSCSNRKQGRAVPTRQLRDLQNQHRGEGSQIWQGMLVIIQLNAEGDIHNEVPGSL